MSTGVLITIIICGMVLLLVIIGLIAGAAKRKRKRQAAEKLGVALGDLWKQIEKEFESEGKNGSK